MKRIIRVLISCILVISLVGCGGNSNEHEGEAKTPACSSVQKGRDYQEVIDDFEEKGFKNVKTEKLEDLIAGWLTKDGEVEAVSVDGNTSYSQDVWYPNDVEVIITYHTFDQKEDEVLTVENNEDLDILVVNGETESKPDAFAGYTLIEVDGGNLSGHREPNVVVDIGYGNREYYAFTNEFGQLVRVIADEIILQDDSVEPVLSTGRYYSDEAKVPGVESPNLDEGHVIADSLGGVSNAYNITPQNSTLNRHGDQAYMEKWIRDAGGCTNFQATITYPNTQTQIPSKYKFTYTLNGDVIVDEYENINPDDTVSNSSQEVTSNSTPKVAPQVTTEGDLSKIDTNGNGIVTIAEAKKAGYSMPITSDHWLYQYMKDSDGDGMVGE
ncbi:DNA/RNA non-specific endonuclease [Anaerotignum propionicum]|uniref:DNA/RNA non-specific endonuclease n=1 Tax=Anaerotignum propionicum TaxID=28446 RepID=UPI00289A569C|nr:DNA/RNA non-specific endonuclease [Anaerotignum propionicum]